MKRVEGVEKLFLKCVFALDELDVIDQQHVALSVATFESSGGVASDRFDELIHEGLGRDVPHVKLREVLDDVVPNGLQEMGFAKAGITDDEQRVVRTRWSFRNRKRRSV